MPQGAIQQSQNEAAPAIWGKRQSATSHQLLLGGSTQRQDGVGFLHDQRDVVEDVGGIDLQLVRQSCLEPQANDQHVALHDNELNHENLQSSIDHGNPLKC